MKHEPVILPTISAVTTTGTGGVDQNGKPVNGVSGDINATNADKVLLCISGPATVGITNPMANTETVLIYTVSSTGGAVPVYNQSGTQAQLTGATGAVVSSILLEGGFIYRLVKTATAAAIGVDAYLKPRGGP